MQGRYWLVHASTPPQTWMATDSDSIEDSALNSAQAGGTGTLSGMLLDRELEPYTLAIGAHPKNSHRDPPRAFAFCVCSRSLAGVVVAMQTSREIARLAGIWRGPALRLEDVATKSRTVRRWCCVHHSLGHSCVIEQGWKRDVIRILVLKVWK
jgi:hypothetical protein